MKKITLLASLASVAVLATVTITGCTTTTTTDAGTDYRAEAIAMMKTSFNANGQAGMDRLDQDAVQRLCDGATETPARSQESAALQKAELAAVKFPADGKFLGSYVAGEAIAQTGRGFQWNDKAGDSAGGNCYACHQITKQEIAYGNLGPSLYQYGKLRGNSDAVLRYTWAKIYNAKAYNTCSNMPRFGHKGILTEQQLKDVMALLLDPASPTNQ